MALSTLGRRVPLPRHLRESGVGIGALSTVVVFFVLTAVSLVFDFEAFQQWIYQNTGHFWDSNPIPGLKYLGGIPVGYVATIFSDERTFPGRIKVAGMAAAYGWVVIILLWIGYNLATSQYFPPPVIVVSVFTVINAMWFIPAYVAGAFGGAILVELQRL